MNRPNLSESLKAIYLLGAIEISCLVEVSIKKFYNPGVSYL